MRASFIVALGLSAIASASAKALFLRDYPACADTCIANANLEGCSVTDYKCLCTNTAFLDSTSQCIYNECTNPKDLQQALQTADEACLAAGITITSTYTPTQSLSQTASQTSGTVSATITTPVNGTSSSTTPSGTSTSSSAPAATSSNAAVRLGSSSAQFAMFGAAVLGAFAL